MLDKGFGTVYLGGPVGWLTFGKFQGNLCQIHPLQGQCNLNGSLHPGITMESGSKKVGPDNIGPGPILFWKILEKAGRINKFILDGVYSTLPYFIIWRFPPVLCDLRLLCQ